MAQYNWDTLGIPVPKARKETVSLPDFKKALEWVKRHIYETFGEDVSDSVLDGKEEFWFLYSKDGTFVTKIEHDLVERIRVALEGLEFIDTMVKDGVVPVINIDDTKAVHWLSTDGTSTCRLGGDLDTDITKVTCEHCLKIWKEVNNGKDEAS